MAYFNQQFIKFFEGLKAHNTSEWFADNRPVYEKEVKKPFLALVTDLIDQLQAEDTRLLQQPKDAIFRINRDIRFSKDKRPYKEHVSALVSRFGKKVNLPGFYFQLSADECWIGGGAYEVEKDQLAAIRSEIFYNTEEFRGLLNANAFKTHYGGQILGEKGKILPSPYKEAVKEEPYLANKQFYYMATYAGHEMVLRPDLLDVLVTHWQAAKPLNEFMTIAMLGNQE